MFMLLTQRGPPLLGPTLAMAARQAELWLAQREEMTDRTAETVTRVAEMIEGVAAFAGGESLFVAFRSAERCFAPPDPYRRPVRAASVGRALA